MTKWKEEHGGYELHKVSAITEWLGAISTMIYLYLFSNEFRTITFEEPPILVTDTHVAVSAPSSVQRY